MATATWIELARHLELRTLYGEVATLAGRQKRPCWPLMWRKAIKPQTPAQVRRIWRLLTGRGQHPWRSALIDVAFPRRIGLKERFHALQGHRLKPLTSSRCAHFYALTWGGLIQHTEQSNKLASARFGRGAASVSRHQAHGILSWPSFRTKAPQRVEQNGHAPGNGGYTAGAGAAPLDKVDFRPSSSYWLLQLDPELADEAVLGGARAMSQYVDVQRLEKAYSRLRAHKSVETSYSSMLSAASLAHWLTLSGLKP